MISDNPESGQPNDTAQDPYGALNDHVLAAGTVAQNAKAPDGGFRLMIAMRCDKAAFVNRLDRTSTCVACRRPVGGMSNRDRLVVRRTVAFASPACTIEACRIRRSASRVSWLPPLWI
jgi:hypothetical protein